MNEQPNKKITAFILGLIYFAIEIAVQLIIVFSINEKYQNINTYYWSSLISYLPISSLAVSGYSILIIRELSKYDLKKNDKKILEIFIESKRYTIYSVLCAVLLIVTIVIFQIQNSTNYLISLLIFLIGIISRAIMLWIFSIYNGTKNYGIDKLNLIACSVTSCVACLYVINMNYEIYVIAISYTTPYAICATILCLKMKALFGDHENKTTNLKYLNKKEIFKIYLINIAGFLTLNTDQFVANYFLSNEEFIEYAILSKIIFGVIAITGIFINLQLNMYSKLSTQNKFEKLQKITFKNSIFLIFISAIAGGIMIYIYPKLINTIINKQVPFDNETVLIGILFSIIATITANYGNSIMCIGENNLVIISLLSSITGVILTIIGVINFGINGLMIGMLAGIVFSACMHTIYFKKIVSKKYDQNN
jgi:O-antigen/teichoic acid export membrane protein